MRPQKHSLTIRGHRTSVTLEPPFWEAFREIAARKRKTFNQFATEIDIQRGVEMTLASAIRVRILREVQNQLRKNTEQHLDKN